ncbi:hypothetical protein ACHAWO_001900 [Cyclotella atomus]|uniref:Uncharacterized protein n=1 Tax=Cyclotella atomus TaxID=382360 RepID=A0ABD3NI68_9STRA
MGRKKGKQSGDFHCKKLNAEHLHKLYVDNASEANRYRNPVSSCPGRGSGYRASSSAPTNENIAGRWDSTGRSCHGDKWSTIFANRSSTEPYVSSSRHGQNAARGLAHLRHLLEDRRTEDRMHDRQHRLAVQRSRIRGSGLSFQDSVRGNNTFDPGQQHLQLGRNEPGWIISQPMENTNDWNRIPSLQLLAAQVLGPLLPMHVAACGHDFMGDCLKSASPEVLAQLSISLAQSSSQSDEDEAIYATTDGVVKALVHSGVATRLVLKGAPLVQTNDFEHDEEESIQDTDDDVDTRWLSDQGLLALCPRLLPQSNLSGDAFHDDWETLDVDLDLTSRLAGCFHLTRLELIDIPLGSSSAQGGVTLGALRHALQSCPGITHLGLSGCFYNTGSVREAGEDVNLLLCGTKQLTSQSSTADGGDKVSHGFSQYDGFEGNEMSEIKGLHELLPELQVLDLSHCNWVTPMMIFRFLMQCREASVVRSYDARGNNTESWVVNCTDQTSDALDCKRPHKSLDLSLPQLGLMGCNISPDDVKMIDEWISHSLFGCVKLLSS